MIDKLLHRKWNDSVKRKSQLDYNTDVEEDVDKKRGNDKVDVRGLAIDPVPPGCRNLHEFTKKVQYGII